MPDDMKTELRPGKPSVLGESIGLQQQDTEGLIDALKRGLQVKSFEQLRELLELSKAELAEIVGISERTLMRRMKTGRFTTLESERIYRIARLLGRIEHGVFS
jgi:putative toxin-antitoxin system antitoxin component (TIGR02293 family)